MTAPNDFATNADTRGRYRPAAHRMANRIRNLWRAQNRRAQERAARRVLMAMDERLLADIGLRPADLYRPLSEVAAEHEQRRNARRHLTRRPVQGEAS